MYIKKIPMALILQQYGCKIKIQPNRKYIGKIIKGSNLAISDAIKDFETYNKIKDTPQLFECPFYLDIYKKSISLARRLELMYLKHNMFKNYYNYL